jgi:hypothetical protein
MYSVSSNAVAQAMGWSFTEQKVGVFDDGSALYRKMVKGTIPVNGSYQFPINVPNLKNLVSWRGNFYQGSFSNPQWVMHVPYTYLEGSPVTNWLTIYCYFYPQNKTFETSFMGGGVYATAYYTGEVIFFCEYTKTTD